ncbi:MAG TPA: tetratricopeptide repeat protein, partial [Terriglobales bacterium]|nr:tetratricopeptide repeat protein [Terriglobales bacterium]
MQDATQAAGVRRFGAFEINLQSGELRKQGIRLRLSGQPFQLLAILVEHAGEVVTREELHGKLWPADTFVDFDHGLNNAIARIREVLDDSASTPRYVETIPRRGYRFIAPVTDVPPLGIFLPAAESRVSPVSNVTPSVLPIEKRAASRRLVLLLGGTVTLALIFAWVLYRTGAPKRAKQPAIKSLAVLPLKNLSGDPSQEYLADAMTEAVIGRLSRIHDLRVISRTSVMRFKNTQLSVRDIAGTLRVDAVVEGSVIREGNRIRVYAQLIRADTDEHFWSETYDREMGDVLALQSDVARSIAEKVEVTITGQEQSRLVAARYVSPEVYESYLKGAIASGNSQADIEKRIGYFEQAISKDPTFAPAYVGLAEAYDAMDTILVGAPPAEVHPKIISAAQKALELDPQLAEPHALLADVYQARWQWTDAEAEYQRALELNPNDPAAHLGYADWLMCQGRTDEALAYARRARELDPLGVTGVSIGWILFQARRYDVAIRELRSVVAVHPDYAAAHWFLGFALIGNGQPELAIPELEKTASLMHRSPGSLELLATANARAGHRREALRLLNELKRERETTYVSAGAFISPYLALGDYDQAFVWFERAYQEHSDILLLLKVHPFFDPVRQDPRFKDLLRR